ncbi:MAG TPA: PKD domain-containing protein [Lunatimonas sp.]|nr:PKD domain-containing protein [Lunatimonas sp.]
MKRHNYFIGLITLFLVWACVEEYSLDAPPPSAEDAQFGFQASTESDNILNFSADGDFFMMNWDLGNGSQVSGKTVTGTYPLAGEYTVTLTVFNAGGSAAYSQVITIDQTDPVLLDKPLYNLLTGGPSATEGKTWVLDSARSGHFGVGPDPSQAGDFPEWYQAQPNEKAGGGMYDDRYTFLLADFGFVMQTNGDVYINAAQGPNFPGAEDSGVGDLRAPYTPPATLSWSIVEPADDYPLLTIANGGFIGYFAGGRTYQIVNIEENELFLRFVDQANEGLAWYIRLIPAGFDSGAEPEPEPEPELEPGDVNFTLADLVGEGSKTWKLKPAAGAFGVGPNPGSDEWYPGGADLSEERACLFNDLFTFGEDGSMEYDAQGDIFGETYMGLGSDACQPESNLEGLPGAEWASGVHEFSFTPGSGATNPTITVTGTGAFLVLPKAFNGGEYTAGPPEDDKSVTYEVINYINENGTEEVTITINVAPDGGVFWSFVLVPAETE